jgi:hypothetical protein
MMAIDGLASDWIELNYYYKHRVEYRLESKQQKQNNNQLRYGMIWYMVVYRVRACH